MEKYKRMEEVGRGTFGVVYRAVDKETGEVVAVKKLITKFDSWEECMNLPKVKAIKKIKNYPNIIEVKEIIKQKDYMYMVFEYMECNLNQAMAQQEKPFSETAIRLICGLYMGGIMAELLTLKTLFPGESGAGVMHNIWRVFGTPTETTWSEVLYLASNIKYQFLIFMV
nr:cyclin-dependent kinase F-4-like [Tanacetum cinerariifolium]